MKRSLKWWNRVAAVLAVGSCAVVFGGLSGCKHHKPMGADCSSDNDCDSNACSEQGGVCTKTCTFDKDCSGGLLCRAETEGKAECDKAEGQKVGGSCMVGGDCQNGICLHYVGKETQPGVCSKYCQSPEDCPAGNKICSKISDSGALEVCIPGDPKSGASGGPKFGKPSHGGGKKKNKK